MSEMQVEMWNIERLNPYAHNPRKNDEAVPRMVEALQTFGFRIPVLITSAGEVIDGHLRLKAAQVLGMSEIPVLIVDDWTEQQVKAFRILVNRSATWAEWDMDLLLEELRALHTADFDLHMTGFEQKELDKMLMELGGEKDPDALPDVPEIPIVKDGEIWLLGRHRMMCGDSTSAADMRRLLGEKPADMVWTDPPYNVDYHGKAGSIKNDKMTQQQFDQFLLAVHRVMFESVRQGGAVYVAHSESGDGMAFRRAFIGAGFKLAACLIWRKQAAVLGRGDYHFQHEPILYGWRPGAAHKWYGDRKQRTVMDLGLDGLRDMGDGTFQLLFGDKLYRISGEVAVEELPSSIIDVPKPAKSDLHPTTKPVALIERMISNSSPRAGMVLDPFGGSGSTLMACELLGRQCCTMELDPRFAEVIIRRWQEYSGQEAVREVDSKTFLEVCNGEYGLKPEPV